MPEGREVICDTSPLLYLHAIDKLDLLRSLYGSVIVPLAVVEEIAVGRRIGISSPDVDTIDWCHVMSAPAEVARDALVDLGPGEREVLVLARHRAGSLVVLDDLLARRYASILGVRMTGTLGVLLRAKRSSLLPAIEPLIGQLQQSGFRLDPRTRAAVLALAGEAA